MPGGRVDVEARLEELSRMTRVWPEPTAENITPGLIQLCHDWIKPTDTMVEIGCFAGVSTEIFALFARMVFAIDPWTSDDYGQIPATMIQDARCRFLTMASHRHNIMLAEKRAADVLAVFGDGILDAVYIDGDHRPEAVDADISGWRKKLKPGGLLMGHDYELVKAELLRQGLSPVSVYPETSWVVVVP